MQNSPIEEKRSFLDNALMRKCKIIFCMVFCLLYFITFIEFAKSDEYNNLIVTVIKVKKEMVIKKNESRKKSEIKQNIRSFKKSLKRTVES